MGCDGDFCIVECNGIAKGTTGFVVVVVALGGLTVCGWEIRQKFMCASI